MNTLPKLTPEPNPDSLEWMLHSPQVSDAQLIQVLLAEYYEKAYQVALAALTEPRLARKTACQVLAQAVQQRSRYWGELTLEDWILKFVQKILARYKHPSGKSIKKLIRGNLRASELHIPLEQVSRGENPEQAETASLQNEVEHDLENLRRRRLHLSLTGGGILAATSLVVIVLLFGQAGLNLLSPALKPFSRVRFYYPYVTQPGDTLDSIAKIAGVRVQDISPNQGITSTMALDPGVTYWLPSLKPPLWQSLFPRRADVPPPPLNLQSTPAEVKQRILSSASYWQTLWADQLVIQYGPPGYVSQSSGVFRLQTWIQQPDQSLSLRGNPNYSTSWLEAEYRDANRLYVKYNPGSISATEFLSAGELASRTDYHTSPFFLHFPNDDWQVRVVGMETVAGRQTLVVDEYTAQDQRQARLWVDTQFGVVLARRQFGLADSGSDRQPVVEDQVVLSVQFNAKIADSIFDPNRYFSYMAKDPSGAPLEQSGLIKSLPRLQYAPDPAAVNLAHNSPPPGFAPAQSRLTLRMLPQPGDGPLDFPGQGNGLYPQMRSIEVYGDEFYLGTQTFQIWGPPQFLSCVRSPDGNLVAFRLGGISSSPTLYWFSMTDPPTVHTLPGKVYLPGEFAFSPSSRQMAFFGCNGDYFVWGCGIGLLNFDTGKVATFMDLGEDYVTWLGWSPDGKYLAAVLFPQNSPYPDGQAYLKLYRLSDERVSYTGSYNLNTYQAAADSPTQSWGAAFQPQLAPLKGCALP